MICDACGRSYPEDGTNIRCICRKKYEQSASTPRPYDPTWPCAIRGDEIGVMDCGCQGSPKVWLCPLHGVCAARKLKPGVMGYIDNEGIRVEATISFCNRCPDRK